MFPAGRVSEFSQEQTDWSVQSIMWPALSTVTDYPTSVSSPALVHIYNKPLADPPPCPIHTGPKHSILTH